MTFYLDIAINRAHCYSVGVEETTYRYYLSIPVANASAIYEEYYQISEQMFRQYVVDEQAAAAFAGECRTHHHDDRLMQLPRVDRGVPWRPAPGS